MKIYDFSPNWIYIIQSFGLESRPDVIERWKEPFNMNQLKDVWSLQGMVETIAEKNTAINYYLVENFASRFWLLIGQKNQHKITVLISHNISIYVQKFDM